MQLLLLIAALLSLRASALNPLKFLASKLNMPEGTIVAGTAIAAGAAIFAYAKQPLFDTADWIPMDYIKGHKTISGIVVKVTDGDTYRIRHTPTFFSSQKYKGLLSEHTISVRIAAVDTPETAKFGKDGQKYGEVAKSFAMGKLLNKKVYVKCLSKDQYGRIVGTVKYNDGAFGKKDISEELLKSGLALVYRQSGGQYDGDISKWNKIEDESKRSRLGIWGEKDFETPAEYKKRTK